MKWLVISFKPTFPTEIRTQKHQMWNHSKFFFLSISRMLECPTPNYWSYKEEGFYQSRSLLHFLHLANLKYFTYANKKWGLLFAWDQSLSFSLRHINTDNHVRTCDWSLILKSSKLNSYDQGVTLVTTIVFQNLSTWAKIRLSCLNALVYRHTTNGDVTATPVNTGMAFRLWLGGPGRRTTSFPNQSTSRWNIHPQMISMAMSRICL